MTRRGSAVGDSALSTAGVLAQGLARFAYTAIVGRALGADVLATVNLGFSVAILLSLVWPTAVGNAAAAFVRPGAEGTALRRRLERSTAISLVPIGVSAAAIALLLGSTPLGAVLVLALTLAWSCYIVGRGMRMGMAQLAGAALWDVLSAVTAVLLLLLAVLLEWVAVLLVPAIAGYALFALAALLAARRAASTTAPSPRTPPLRPFLFWNSAGLVATNGLMQFSMVVVFALSLATPVSMISQAVTQALLPRFAEWGALDSSARRERALRTLIGVGGIMAVGCGAVAACMPWVLPLFFGDAFVAAVPIAQLLMIGVFGFSVSVLLAAFLSAIGRARRATLLAGVSSLVGLAVMVAVGLLVGGTAGAIWGVSVGMMSSALALAAAALADGPRTSRADVVG